MQCLCHLKEFGDTVSEDRRGYFAYIQEGLGDILSLYMSFTLAQTILSVFYIKELVRPWKLKLAKSSFGLMP
jgi:uncharacterized protein YciW